MFPPCNLTGLQLNMQAVIDQNVIMWYMAVQALLSAFSMGGRDTERLSDFQPVSSGAGTKPPQAIQPAGRGHKPKTD